MRPFPNYFFSFLMTGTHPKTNKCTDTKAISSKCFRNCISTTCIPFPLVKILTMWCLLKTFMFMTHEGPDSQTNRTSHQKANCSERDYICVLFCLSWQVSVPSNKKLCTKTSFRIQPGLPLQSQLKSVMLWPLIALYTMVFVSISYIFIIKFFHSGANTQSNRCPNRKAHIGK